MQQSTQKTHIATHSRIMGPALASIGFLLLILGCSELTESAMEQNTMKMTDNIPVSNTDNMYRIPPMDAGAPLETETATFALG